MNLKVNRLKIFKIFALVILIIAPWANADFTDSISAGVPIQEDMSFYEINPCKVSLIEFIMKVPSSIYQDRLSPCHRWAFWQLRRRSQPFRDAEIVSACDAMRSRIANCHSTQGTRRDLIM